MLRTLMNISTLSRKKLVRLAGFLIDILFKKLTASLLPGRVRTHHPWQAAAGLQGRGRRCRNGKLLQPLDMAAVRVPNYPPDTIETSVVMAAG